MRLIFFGPPGAGKGTQASKITSQFHLAHLSTGDMFRAAIRNQTSIGQEAQEYMKQGLLVPDEVVCGIAQEGLENSGMDNFILDGFPRTIPQATWFDAFAEKNGSFEYKVISLVVPDTLIVERLSQRRSHRVTKEIYHLTFNPPPPEIAPEDLIHRADDKPEAIQERLRVYREQTEPLATYYKEKGVLFEVDGVGSIKEVFSRIHQILAE